MGGSRGGLLPGCLREGLWLPEVKLWGISTLATVPGQAHGGTPAPGFPAKAGSPDLTPLASDRAWEWKWHIE